MTINITSFYSDEKQEKDALQRIVKQAEQILMSVSRTSVQSSEEDKRMFNKIDQMVDAFRKGYLFKYKYIVQRIWKATNEIVYSCRFDDLNTAYSYIGEQSPILLLDYSYTVEEII